MEYLYEWIRNLVGYFLFLSVLQHLLPHRKYEKYIRLFAGMVLLLLLFQPLRGTGNMEEKLARLYEGMVFQYEAEDLRQELLGVEEERLSRMIGQYEEAVEQEIRQMLSEMGLEVLSCRVEVQDEETSERFGRVKRVALTVQETERMEGEREKQTKERNDAQIVSVEAVRIAVGGAKTETAKKEDQEQVQKVERMIKNEMSGYYDLEEDYVEIQVVQGER